MWELWVVLAVIVVALIIAFVKMDDGRPKCPCCGKKNFLVEKERKLLKVEDFSKIELRNRYDKNRRVIGSREVRVFGKKETYSVIYHCTNCNYTFKTTDVREKITH